MNFNIILALATIIACAEARPINNCPSNVGARDSYDLAKPTLERNDTQSWYRDSTARLKHGTKPMTPEESSLCSLTTDSDSFSSRLFGSLSYRECCRQAPQTPKKSLAFLRTVGTIDHRHIYFSVQRQTKWLDTPLNLEYEQVKPCTAFIGNSGLTGLLLPMVSGFLNASWKVKMVLFGLEAIMTVSLRNAMSGTSDTCATILPSPTRPSQAYLALCPYSSSDHVVDHKSTDALHKLNMIFNIILALATIIAGAQARPIDNCEGNVDTRANYDLTRRIGGSGASYFIASPDTDKNPEKLLQGTISHDFIQAEAAMAFTLLPMQRPQPMKSEESSLLPDAERNERPLLRIQTLPVFDFSHEQKAIRRAVYSLSGDWDTGFVALFLEGIQYTSLEGDCCDPGGPSNRRSGQSTLSTVIPVGLNPNQKLGSEFLSASEVSRKPFDFCEVLQTILATNCVNTHLISGASDRLGTLQLGTQLLKRPFVLYCVRLYFRARAYSSTKDSELVYKAGSFLMGNCVMNYKIILAFAAVICTGVQSSPTGTNDIVARDSLPKRK
ncbi:uncharacterized protein STEHIDRAFT_112730 [Stereum hirsutum FP-91666 SS1]|uniref:uncharacterized protein n=1 Tax=Stereum hirsutum (strain FP-91666) TaxID=721885 RepID=UPI0004449E93|nr:uncharacterized protein STEHIDRAFT_112730 [Stereum hirsutum FP-91666 SS1]EIM84315.1 hypothetical protein STEHIDRAFT_112730 [Stereum hirsutum FP-91666 SS1]